MTGRRRAIPLLSLVARRILAFALLAMVIQFGLVFSDYWFDDTELGRILIERETEAIADSVVLRDGNLVVDRETEAVGHYTGLDDGDETDGTDDAGKPYDDGDSDDRPATFIRIRSIDPARILYTNCTEACREHFLPMEIDPPDFWQSLIRPGKPLSVSGGRAFVVDGRKILVEIAVVRDPGNFIASILMHEMMDHMVVPMTLMLVLVIGATILSVRKALAPVREAALLAETIDPAGTMLLDPGQDMPREISHLTLAINRLLTRARDLLQSQRLFSAAIAHEIRTPVSIVQLELARIADPRARRAEGDLNSLMHILEQLTALARVDSVDGSAFETVDLDALASETVADLAPFVMDRGKRIGYQGDAGIRVKLVPSLIQNLVRNLVENAVKHTPDGTTILVSVGSDGSLTVADDGPGMSAAGTVSIDGGRIKRSGAIGIGLRIVERIAELHGTAPVITSVPGGGTSVRLQFQPVEDA